MRVVVTGHRGLVGRAVDAALSAAGHTVIGFDLLEGQDITDLQAVLAGLIDADAVVHLAALDEPSTAPTELAPVSTGTADAIFDVNVGGTANVLAAARAHGIRRLIHLSSVDVFGCFLGQGVPHHLPLDESHPLDPKGPYASSKLAAELLVRAFSEETGAVTVTLRAPGVFTEETSAFVRQARIDDPEFEWTPYWEFGAFIDVRDLADAVTAALTSPVQGADTLLVNASDISSAEQTTMQLLRRLQPHVPVRNRAAFDLDPFLALIDTTRAREALGWSPRHAWRPKHAADGG